MSTSQVGVKYNFNLTTSRGETSDGNFPIFTNGTGMTDALAIALTKAFRDLPWPAGTSVFASVTKHETDEIQSEGDLSTGLFV